MGTTRFTRQRAELLAVLDEVDAFRTPLQIYRKLRTHGAGVGPCAHCSPRVVIQSDDK